MSKLIDISIALLALAGSGLACNRVGGVKLTNYGFPDASGVPAYHCNGGNPGPSQPNGHTILGDGSFGKPYAAAAATDSNTFKKCDKIYVPILKKYFQIQDDCGECHSNKEKRVDLYLIQSNKNIGQTNCELQFGNFNYDGNSNDFDHNVIVNPGKGFQTNTQPLFKSKKCFNKASQGRVFPKRDGSVKCGAGGAEADEATIESTTARFSDEPKPVDINDSSSRNVTTSEPPLETEGEGDIPEGQADFRGKRMAKLRL